MKSHAYHMVKALTAVSRHALLCRSLGSCGLVIVSKVLQRPDC